MHGLLIALSGARADILERCPSERARFVGVGGAVLTTAVVAALSMWFALAMAMSVHPVLAAPIALAWGLAILSLDRWLVASMPAEGRHRFMMAFPRVLMAVLLGVVVSTPLVLQIFRPEIDARIVQIKQERANAFVAESQRGELGQRIAALTKTSTELAKVIATGGDVPVDPAQDPTIAALTAERDMEVKRARQHYTEWQCQLYGGSGCDRKGSGPLAEASEREYRKSQSRVAQLNAEIEMRKKRLTDGDPAARRARLDEAKARLPQVTAELSMLNRQQSDLQKSFTAENIADDGLLLRLEALDDVAADNAVLAFARLAIFLLFMVIGCLPVAVKLMQRPGVYEQILALESRSEFRQAREVLIGMGRTQAEPSRTTTIQEIRDLWLPANAPVADRHRAARDRGSSSDEDAALRSLDDTRTRGDDDWSDLFPDEA